MKLATADDQLLDDLLASPVSNWKRFVDRYASTVWQTIQHCCQAQGWQLEDDEMQVVLQATFQCLAADNLAILRAFDGQSRFTTYLTIAARRIVLERLQHDDKQRRLKSALVADTSQRLQIPQA